MSKSTKACDVAVKHESRDLGDLAVYDLGLFGGAIEELDDVIVQEACDGLAETDLDEEEGDPEHQSGKRRFRQHPCLAFTAQGIRRSNEKSGGSKPQHGRGLEQGCDAIGRPHRIDGDIA